MPATGSSEVQRTIPGRNGGVLTPYRKGQTGNPGGLTPERRALLDAIEKNHIPKVTAMLDRLFDIASGDDLVPAVAAAKLWLDQVRGPVKARDDDAIMTAVHEQLVALIMAARQRRAEQNGDAPTDR
jgi:hypothetical protein